MDYEISKFDTSGNRGDMVNYEEMKSKYISLFGRTGFIVKDTDWHSLKNILENFLLMRFDGCNLKFLCSRNEFWEYLPKIDSWRFVPKQCLKDDITSFLHAGQYLFGFNKCGNIPHNKGVKSIIEFMKIQKEVLAENYLQKPKQNSQHRD